MEKLVTIRINRNSSDNMFIKDSIKPAHKNDSGIDLYSDISTNILPGHIELISTGVFIDYIEPGYEIQIRTKSGNAIKRGLIVLNSPGTVDANYRGELKVIVYNAGKTPIIITQSTKVAQFVLCPVIIMDNNIIDVLISSKCTTVENNNTRNDNGFGSTD